MDRSHASTDTRRGFPLLGALAAAMFLAAPDGARAGDEFEDGFKDELGRLAAHEAVVVGRGVLAQVLLGGYPGYYYPVDYPTHRPRYYDDHHGHGGRGDGHYRHHDGWRHGYYPPRWGHGYRGHGYGWGHYGHHRPRYHHQRHHHHHGCGH